LNALAGTANIPFHIFTATYGLHSLRFGGATLVAANKVPDHTFQENL